MQGAPDINMPEGPSRLRPDMASFRLLVLDFVAAYLAKWGQGPSYSEIANHLAADRYRVRWAVKRLVKQGRLVQQPGPRGLAMPDACSAAARVLAEHGWAVDAPTKTATNAPLPRVVVLDYHPPHGSPAEFEPSSNA